MAARHDRPATDPSDLGRAGGAVGAGSRPAENTAAIARQAAESTAPAQAAPRAGEQRLNRGAKQGRGLLLDSLEPWPEPVDGAGLFGDVVATLRRYVALPPGSEVTISLWVALTYLTDEVDVLPRLWLTSPTRACGKSRLLAVLGGLVCRALSASSITPSATFRVIEAAHPTLLLDEMDNARLDENPELRAVLNSGHERANAWTVRNVGEQHEVHRFSTWAPVALASIGRLPDTVASRCVKVAMRRRAPGERIEQLRSSRLAGELEPLRRRLARWCQDHAAQVREAEPHVPGALEDRAADNWTPLLAIADAIGGACPEQARSVAAASDGMGDDETPGLLILSDLRTLFTERSTDRLSTEDILVALGCLEARPWSEWRRGEPLAARGLARLLKPFGVEPGPVRFGTEFKRGYLLDWLDDAFTRYLPPMGSRASRAAIDAAGSLQSEPSLHVSVTAGESASQPHESCPVTDVTDVGSGDDEDGASPLGPEKSVQEVCPHCAAAGRIHIYGERRTPVCGACYTRLDKLEHDPPAPDEDRKVRSA